MPLLTVPDRPLGRGKPFAIHACFSRDSWLWWVVHDVLEGMLPTEIPVPLPGDPLLVDIQQKQWVGGGTLVAREWLPAVCQSIRLNDLREIVAGMYFTNYEIALLRHGDRRGVWGPPAARGSRLPRGVTSLWSEIILDRPTVEQAEFADDAGVLSFILAHEIVHAVNTLGIVAPALVDWDAFRAGFRSGPNDRDSTVHARGRLNMLLDGDDADEVLALVGRFWPLPQVQEWFE